ncbi:MAG: DUF2784 family protein [Saprospirales bacterium]|nr:MAG: DUF2784 family protein [Saprospirales bacterium]
MYLFLDYLFIVFHSLLILFNVFGWLFPALRFWNFITLLMTGGSWFILGIFYGIGYCPLTDWHYMVLRELGETGMPPSYIQYILDRLLGIQITPLQADTVTVGVFFLALMASLYVNINAYRRRRELN